MLLQDPVQEKDGCQLIILREKMSHTNHVIDQNKIKHIRNGGELVINELYVKIFDLWSL